MPEQRVTPATGQRSTGTGCLLQGHEHIVRLETSCHNVKDKRPRTMRNSFCRCNLCSRRLPASLQHLYFSVNPQRGKYVLTWCSHEDAELKKKKKQKKQADSLLSSLQSSISTLAASTLADNTDYCVTSQGCRGNDDLFSIKVRVKLETHITLNNSPGIKHLYLLLQKLA